VERVSPDRYFFNFYIIFNSMYLKHRTCLEHLKPILKSGFLKSSKLTKKIGLGEDVYISSKYVFLSVVEKLFQIGQNGDNNVVLYLDPKVLKNREFYVSEKWDDQPNLQEHGTKKIKRDTHYKMKEGNQVAVANKISITPKYLVGIEINSSKNPSPLLIKFIQLNYPSTVIVRNPYSASWDQTHICEL
jgi:quinol monooxygenase YgiN